VFLFVGILLLSQNGKKVFQFFDLGGRKLKHEKILYLAHPNILTAQIQRHDLTVLHTIIDRAIADVRARICKQTHSNEVV